MRDVTRSLSDRPLPCAVGAPATEPRGTPGAWPWPGHLLVASSRPIATPHPRTPQARSTVRWLVLARCAARPPRSPSRRRRSTRRAAPRSGCSTTGDSSTLSWVWARSADPTRSRLARPAKLVRQWACSPRPPHPRCGEGSVRHGGLPVAGPSRPVSRRRLWPSNDPWRGIPPTAGVCTWGGLPPRGRP